MLKRVFFILLFIAVLSLLAIAYFYYRPEHPAQMRALHAISPDAPLVMGINDLHGFIRKLRKTTFWTQLNTIPPVSLSDERLRFLDSLISANSRTASLFEGHPVYLSLHSAGAKQYAMLFTMDLPNPALIHHAEQLILELAGSPVPSARDSGRLKSREYEEVTIRSVPVSTGPEGEVETLYYSFTEGLWLASFNEMLLEEAIRQLRAGSSIADNRLFIKVKNTAGTAADANLYVNYRTFPSFLASFLKPAASGSITELCNFACWTEADLHFREKALLFNGLTTVNDSDGSFGLALFDGRPPPSSRGRRVLGGETTITRILPAHTAYALFLNFSDFNAYYSRYRTHLELLNRGYDRNDLIGKINAMYDVNVEKALLSWIGQGYTVACTAEPASGKDDVPYRYYAFFQINQEINLSGYKTPSEEVHHMLTQFAKNIAKVQVLNPELAPSSRGLPPQDPTETFQENFRGYDIGFIPLHGILEKLLGRMFLPIKLGYYTIIDEYVVFSENPGALKSLINDWLTGNTLGRSPSYNKFTDHLSSASHIFLYANIPLVAPLIQSSTEKEWSDIMGKYAGNFSKFGGFSIQFSTNHDMYYTHLYLENEPLFHEKTRWFVEVKLDTAVAMKPAVVVNHKTKGKEIFIQDAGNTIHLLSATGQILWSRPLSARIISEIYQIDAYRNGKLQLLFNTSDSLYLFDRLGNEVEGYPVKFPSPATAGISVFDYDRNRTYSILVPCEDLKVYNYQQCGKTTRGWEFSGTESSVTMSVLHIRIEGKNYIVIVDHSGKIYVIDRKGKEQLKVLRRFMRPAHDTYYVETGKTLKTSRLIGCESPGMVQIITFNGEKDILRPAGLTTTPRLFWHDVNGNGKKDYLFLDRDELIAYESSGKLLWTVVFNNSTSDYLVPFTQEGNCTWTAVLCSEANAIYLVSPEGNITQDSPFYGNTPFTIADLDGDGTQELITGGQGNHLYVYSIVQLTTSRTPP